MATMDSTNDYIIDDAKEISSCGKVVMAILNYGSAKITRIHKMALFVGSILEGTNEKTGTHGAYHFGGFSEEIDSTLTQFLEDGIVNKINGEFYLTEYGKKIIKVLEEIGDTETKNAIMDSNKIIDYLRELNDDNLLRLTYLLFPETTTNSKIKERVEQTNQKRPVTIKGFHVYKGTADEFKTLMQMISDKE